MYKTTVSDIKFVYHLNYKFHKNINRKRMYVENVAIHKKFIIDNFVIHEISSQTGEYQNHFFKL